MNILKRGVILAVFILFSFLVSAGINVNLIKTDYGPGELIEGSFNYSFAQDLPSNTPVVIDVNGDVIYEDILKNLLSSPFILDPNYTVSGAPISTKTYSFSAAGEQTLAAIDLTGVTNVESVVLNITGSPFGNSDFPNLPSISIGDKPVKTIWTYRGDLIPNDFGGLGRLYLNTLTPDTEVFAKGGGNSIYCEEVTLKPTSKYKVTANVKKIISGSNLIASISDTENPDTNCNINAYNPDDDTQCCELLNIGTAFSDKSCTVNREVVAEEQAFLCLYANSGESDKEYFTIATESDPDHAEGYYNGEKSSFYDFFIWGFYNQFKTNLTGKVNVSGFQTDLNDYVDTVAPITIKTNGPGSVKLDDLDAGVDKGGSIHIKKFTPITYNPEKVKADFLTQRFE